MLGIAIDPNFATNKFVYLYYDRGQARSATYQTPTNRVSRFTTVLGSGTNETVILDPIPSDNGFHSGATSCSAPTEPVYVSVGDRRRVRQPSQTVDTLRARSCVSVPTARFPWTTVQVRPSWAQVRQAGPPPPEGSGPCKEVYAYGLRESVSPVARASNSSVLIGDDRVGRGRELNTLCRERQYGWSDFKGPCPRLPDANCVPDTTPYPSGHISDPFLQPRRRSAGADPDHHLAGAFAQNGGNPAPYAGACISGIFCGLDPRAHHEWGQRRDGSVRFRGREHAGSVSTASADGKANAIAFIRGKEDLQAVHARDRREQEMSTVHEEFVLPRRPNRK